jgi:hypothetical protein
MRKKGDQSNSVKPHLLQIQRDALVQEHLARWESFALDL